MAKKIHTTVQSAVPALKTRLATVHLRTKNGTLLQLQSGVIPDGAGAVRQVYIGTKVTEDFTLIGEFSDFAVCLFSDDSRIKGDSMLAAMKRDKRKRIAEVLVPNMRTAVEILWRSL